MKRKAIVLLGASFVAVFLIAGIISHLVSRRIFEGEERCTYYKGVCYTTDYKELIDWPDGCMAREIKNNSGVVTPDLFHPNVEVIRSGSLHGIKGAEVVVFPWGITHVYDAVSYAVNVVPDTVVEAPSSNDGIIRGSPVYMSYPMNSTRKEPLSLSIRDMEWPCIEYPWYEYYDIHPGWNAMPNGKAYYLLKGEGDKFQVGPYMCRGWQEIDGARYYFDDNGALTEAELEEGLYEFDSVSFLVDSEGKVSLPEGWQKIGGKWRRFDENGVEESGALVGIESWLRGLWE